MLLDTKLLRQKVLDLAIRGLLVPQLDSEPAVEQLGKAPKDVPFEIPEKWKWVQLNTLGKTTTGSTPPKNNPNYYGNDIPFINPGDIQNSKITFRADGLSNEARGIARIVSPFSILMVCIGSIGKCAINAISTSFNQQINALTPDETHYYKLIFYFLISQYFQNEVKKLATGTVTPIINKTNWSSIYLPLPPLEEQKRIVAKVEEIFAELDAIDKAYSELEQLGTLSKSKILDLAIKGQLAPQLDSEPAVEQLGKAPEDVPFEIPEKWKWVEVNKVCTISPKVSANDDQQVSFIPMSHVSGGYNNKIATDEIKSWGSVKKGFSRFEEGDVLLAKITPCFENMKSCIASNLFNKLGAGSTELIPIRCSSNLYSLFLLYFLKSDYLINYGIQNFKGTAGQKRFSTTALKVCPFPLPPFEEQKRIVAKVEELFALIDAMKK